MLRRVALVVVVAMACRSDKNVDKAPAEHKSVAVADAAPPDPWTAARLDMVEKTIVHPRNGEAGITDERVITAMRLTPRHEFVPPDIRYQAYEDRPLPIGFNSTISQAFIVASMTQAAHVKAGDKVLEIGTGSGYQAAVLAMMGAKVYTIEIREELAKRTRQVLERLGFRDVHLKAGDGYAGWAEEAPFDAILVTCAARQLPKPLLAQLKLGGRMVIPVGDVDQQLIAITKTASGNKQEELMAVRFGPMVGEVDRDE